MFFNIIFRPLSMYTLIVILIAFIFADTIAIFLPKEKLYYHAPYQKTQEIAFPLEQAFALQTTKKKKHKAIQKNMSTSHTYLLKDFSISGIIFTKNASDDNLVILRDRTKNGSLLYKGEYHKGYQLKEVFPLKAKFQRGNDFYWSFLSPNDEKKFLSSLNSSQTTVVQETQKSEYVTMARSIANTIKYKNGKYFIPKELLEDKNSIFRIFSSVRIVNYNVNNKLSFKILYLHPSSIFIRLGLRKNDQIIKINQKEISSFAEPLQLFNNLKNLRQLTLTIKRGNKIKELHYEVY